MLSELKIQNIGIIDNITISFSKGLNVLTGETGAGKSIMVKAFSILLGDKVKSEEIIRSGADTARVSCVLILPEDHKALEILKNSGIDENSGEIIIKRELNAQTGRSKSFINNDAVTISLLKQFGDAVVDIHSTFSHQRILNPLTHIDYLDKYINISSLLKYSDLFIEWQKIKKQIEVLDNKKRVNKEKEEFIRFQINELSYLEKIKEDEEELEKEYNLLSKSSEIKEMCSEINNIVYSGSPNLIKRVKNISELLSNLKEYDLSFADQEEEINTFIISLNEIVSQADNFQNSFAFSPHRINELDTILGNIRRDGIKYGKNLAELKQYLSELKNDIKNMESDDEVDLLRETESSLKINLIKTAKKISSERKKGAIKFQEDVMSHLQELGMEKAVLDVDFISLEQPDKNGIDKVEFKISTNPGESLKPLASIVSGGELCRIMLAFKTILANNDDIQVMIFDEIDANIGGVTSVAAAKKMQMIAENKQLITITHQPQIAAKAKKHFSVIKEQKTDHTNTVVRELTTEQRIKEISRMLGGEDITEVVTEHARQMIIN